MILDSVTIDCPSAEEDSLNIILSPIHREIDT
jgi:hypothetical protein